MRATHIFDGAARGGRIVERDPATHPVGNRRSLRVAGFLMEAECLGAGWLPQDE
jgi:hypothetical protein